MAVMVRVADAGLTPGRSGPGRVLAGNPATSSMVLTSDDKAECGIWQIAPGKAVLVAPRGVFVVLSGRATIAVDGGPTFEVGPGDACVWDGGERTVWTVHETLRKVYQRTRSRD